MGDGREIKDCIVIGKVSRGKNRVKIIRGFREGVDI